MIVTLFKTSDGKIFENIKDATKHENKNKKTKKNKYYIFDLHSGLITTAFDLKIVKSKTAIQFSYIDINGGRNEWDVTGCYNRFFTCREQDYKHAEKEFNKAIDIHNELLYCYGIEMEEE